VLPVTLGMMPVLLDVHFRLTDLDYRPIAGAPVRVAFDDDADWRRPDAGHAFVTDANGEGRFTARVALGTRLRKMPTNFVGSLVSLPQRTKHLRVAAELDWSTFRWRYAVDVYHFPKSGDSLLDGFSVFARDERGWFTREARRAGGGWYLPELGGLALTAPGHEPADFTLAPDASDPSGNRWTLRLAFRRQPPPVRR
jgi:hypothetical protein